MKKRIAWMLTMSLLAGLLVGCDNSNQPTETQNHESGFEDARTHETAPGKIESDVSVTEPDTADEINASFEAAKTAYDALISASEKCIYIMDSVYAAWHFAIYTAPDLAGTQERFDTLVDKAMLAYDPALDALDAVMENMGYELTGEAQYAALEDFNVVLNMVEYYYTANGAYAQIERLLDQAKNALKQIDKAYADDVAYEDLTILCAEVLAYFDYCESVTGSFNQMTETVNTYETNIRNYRSKLAIAFE